MGTTILVIEPDTNPNYAIIHFQGRNGGARDWQWYVDGFQEAIRDAALPGVTFLDGDKTLGRSARVRMPLRAFAYLAHVWARAEVVSRGVEKGDLVIDFSLLPADVVGAVEAEIRQWDANAEAASD